MSDHLQGLNSEFKTKLLTFLSNLKEEHGIVMVPYFGVRTPEEQAKLWRQSRSAADVQKAIAMLEDKGAPYLASVLKNGKPASGPWATNALPGQSWHQFGEGMDCYWQVNGKPLWSAQQQIPGFRANGYKIYAENAPSFGLTSLASIGDWGHVQLRKGSGPHKIMGWPDIDKAMKAKFGPKASK